MNRKDKKWYSDIQREWSITSKLTAREIHEAFPDSQSDIQKNIHSLEEQYRSHVATLSETLSSTNPDERWLRRELLKNSPIAGEALKIRKQIKYLQNLLQHYLPSKHGVAFSELVQKARNADIVLASNGILTRSRRVGGKIVSQCPFHPDKSPSFYLYPDSNTYHCFGCQENGDVISFIMKTRNCSFKEAVRYLTDNL